MKIVFSFLVVSLMIIASSCSTREYPDCYSIILEEQYEETACPQTCPGVCACNGVTYCNECLAAKDGFTMLDTKPCSQSDK
jgi:hypothetical protein